MGPSDWTGESDWRLLRTFKPGSNAISASWGTSISGSLRKDFIQSRSRRNDIKKFKGQSLHGEAFENPSQLPFQDPAGTPSWCQASETTHPGPRARVRFPFEFSPWAKSSKFQGQCAFN